MEAGQIPTGNYAQIAYKYMEETFPKRLAQMCQDHTITTYLQDIQEQTVTAVLDRMKELKTNEQTTYLKRVQEMEHAKMIAEEEIIPAMILTILP